MHDPRFVYGLAQLAGIESALDCIEIKVNEAQTDKELKELVLRQLDEIREQLAQNQIAG